MLDANPADLQPRVTFNAPWEPLILRRGDALGLRALADQFAHAVAPELSNRIRDGRWVTILAWCLVRAQEVSTASGAGAILTRAQQDARYAWLRPLELMWIARTMVLTTDWRKRRLAGQRSIKLWSDFGKNRRPARFGMSEDQFVGYRQTGMYGGYRLAFRMWPGLTLHGDGWTPGSATQQLAKWLDGKLGSAKLPWKLGGNAQDDDYLSPRKAKLGVNQEEQWWLRHWPTFELASRTADANTLPRPRHECTVLPEANLLQPLIFGDDHSGVRRREVAHALEKIKATDHLSVCRALRSKFPTDPIIDLLPQFSRLADAGIDAMDLIATALADQPSITLKAVAEHPDAKSVCDELIDASRAWLARSDIPLSHIETADLFAGAMTNKKPVECLTAVLQHHEQHGGGLHWFFLNGKRIEPLTPPSNGASRYRFRLASLSRLALQSGLIHKVPDALLETDEFEDDNDLEEMSAA